MNVHYGSLSPRRLAAFSTVPGRIKSDYTDFRVEEVPLYPLDDAGTHLFFLVEKRGLTTARAVQELARALGVTRREIGYAGQKDARAVTRQWFSVEHITPETLSRIEHPRLSVLESRRHGNKLRLGHLRGNRFVIRVRETMTSRAAEAAAALTELQLRGVPNYFGPQRYGVRGDNWRIGHALLRDDFAGALQALLGAPHEADPDALRAAREAFEAGDYERARRAWPDAFQAERHALRVLLETGGNARRTLAAIDRRARDFFVSAYQSRVFDAVVAARLAAGLDQLLAGEYAYRHASHNVFRIEDAAREQPRADALEISPAGPLIGPRLSPARGLAAELEAAAFAACGADEGLLSHALLRGLGSRRPLRFPIEEAGVSTGADERGEFMELRFFLPRGCYATTLLREIFDEHTAAAAEERDVE